MVICFTREHKSVILQVAGTANQINYWIFGALGDVTPGVSKKHNYS